MKTKLIIACIAAFILFTSFEVPALRKTPTRNCSQSVASDFSFFRTHRQGKDGVTATWGVTNSSGISTFYVQKTYEDPADPYAYWETWAVMPFTNARSYKATDTGVFPGFISYRVVAVFSNGSEMVTPVSTVHIVSH